MRGEICRKTRPWLTLLQNSNLLYKNLHYRIPLFVATFYIISRPEYNSYLQLELVTSVIARQELWALFHNYQHELYNSSFLSFSPQDYSSFQLAAW